MHVHVFKDEYTTEPTQRYPRSSYLQYRSDRLPDVRWPCGRAHRERRAFHGINPLIIEQKATAVGCSFRRGIDATRARTRSRCRRARACLPAIDLVAEAFREIGAKAQTMLHCSYFDQ